MGTSRSTTLNNITLQLWRECIEKNIWLLAGKIKEGKYNAEAGFESWNVNLDIEWKINSDRVF